MFEEYFSLSKQRLAIAFNVLNLWMIVQHRFLSHSALHLFKQLHSRLSKMARCTAVDNS